jgi:hypothetical protein
MRMKNDPIIVIIYKVTLFLQWFKEEQGEQTRIELIFFSFFLFSAFI